MRTVYPGSIALPLAVLLGASALAQTAPAKTYRRVPAPDLIAGYIAEGSLTEAEGYVGEWNGALVFLAAPMSAQYPLTIVTSTLPPNLTERLTGQCSLRNPAKPMCKIVLRGTVLPKATRSFSADEIVLQ